MKTLISNTTSGATKGILDAIKDRLALGEDCVLLTTDRNVANLERTVLDKLKGVGAEFKVKVLSFTRFAVQTLGDDVKACLTPEGSVMLLADVIERISDGFVYYKHVRPDSLAGEVYAALTALRNSGVSTEDFDLKADKLPPSLKNKAHDLALMHRGYLEALSDKRHDSSTRLESLARLLSDTEDTAITKVNYFLVDMHDFNTPQLEVLRALDKNARSLTVGLVSGFDNRNRRIYPDNTLNKIRALSQNRVIESVVVDNLTPIQKSLSTNLFSYEMLREREVVDVGDSLKVKVALNRQDEVTFVALDILKKVQKGARYKDFELLVGNEAYTPIISSVFSRYGIKHFIDKKEMLAGQTKVKYLLSALSVALKNYRVDEVLDFVKNPIFGLSLKDEISTGEDKIFRFENYVLEYGVNFSAFTRPFEYGDSDVLSVAEEVRKAMVKAIKAVDVEGKKPMADFVAGARKFLENCREQSDAHTERLTSISEYYKKCAEQVDQKLEAILLEIESVLTGEGDLDKFNTVLTSMLKTLKIALVPTFLDSVFVGDMSSKFNGTGDLYVLGANSGSLPPDTEGGAVITPKDEELFEEADINLYPTQRQKIRQNLFTITEILSKCKGKLTISYAQSGVEGELNPSSIIQQFKTMFKRDGAPLTAESISFDNLRASMTEAEDLALMFATDKGVKHGVLTYAVSGRASEVDMSVYRTAYAFMSDGDKIAVDKLYSVPERLQNPPTIHKTSISRLERYFKCPYSYFFNYTLGLKRRDEGEITGLDNGTLLHAVFENFFRALKDGTVNEDNVEALAVNTFDGVVKGDERLSRLSEKPDVRRLLQKLKAEGVRTCKDLYKISLRSEFHPTYLEAEFSKEGTFKPIALDVDGRKVELRGKIDRVDVYDDSFLVIDYKTYKSVDLTASEIYHGEKLQLYIYAQAITQNLDKKIAGVFYLPVYPSYVKEGVQRYKYKGQVSDSDALRTKMDSMVDEVPSDAIIPTPGNAQGKSSTYLDTDGFNARGEYALEMAVSGVRDISSGYVAPRPIENSCTKCEFSGICKYKDKFPRTKYSVQNDVFLHYKDKTESVDTEDGATLLTDTKEGK